MPRLVGPALPAGVLAAVPQPVLSGDGVLLRPFELADAPTVVAAYRDPDIQRWHCRVVDDAEAIAVIRDWRDDWDAERGASWAVTARPGGQVLARVGCRVLSLSEGFAEVAYWVLPEARRRGVASAAVAALTRWAFEDVGFHRLELFHSVANAGSCGVAVASGFAHEGTLRQSVRHTDGWHDMHLHARLRSDL